MHRLQCVAVNACGRVADLRLAGRGGVLRRFSLVQTSSLATVVCGIATLISCVFEQ